jgi:hypothetical protein
MDDDEIINSLQPYTKFYGDSHVGTNINPTDSEHINATRFDIISNYKKTEDANEILKIIARLKLRLQETQEPEIKKKLEQTITVLEDADKFGFKDDNNKFYKTYQSYEDGIIEQKKLEAEKEKEKEAILERQRTEASLERKRTEAILERQRQERKRTEDLFNSFNKPSEPPTKPPPKPPPINQGQGSTIYHPKYTLDDVPLLRGGRNKKNFTRKTKNKRTKRTKRTKRIKRTKRTKKMKV